jgi:hypothetical protein
VRCPAVEPQSAAPLAQIIESKTAGNPFFILRFLGHLNEAGLLIYDTKTGRWSWDIERIEEAGVTENVVALLAQTIGRLPWSTQEVLAIAAGIGNEFSLAMLAGVRGETQRDVARALWKPVHEGLIVPVIGEPRFPWAGGQRPAHPALRRPRFVPITIRTRVPAGLTGGCCACRSVAAAANTPGRLIARSRVDRQLARQDCSRRAAKRSRLDLRASRIARQRGAVGVRLCGLGSSRTCDNLQVVVRAGAALRCTTR